MGYPNGRKEIREMGKKEKQLGNEAKRIPSRGRMLQFRPKIQRGSN